MVPYRLKIALLGLGVLLGYGSAFAHFHRGHGHAGSCVHGWDRETWRQGHGYGPAGGQDQPARGGSR